MFSCREHFDRADVEHHSAGAQMRMDRGDHRAELRHRHGENDDVAGGDFREWAQAHALDLVP